MHHWMIYMRNLCCVKTLDISFTLLIFDNKCYVAYLDFPGLVPMRTKFQCLDKMMEGGVNMELH